MRRCDRACVTLEHMRGAVPRADARRFALVSHLFLRCLPAPALDETNFWAREMSRATQTDLLFLLRRCAFHAAAAAGSLRATRALDGERVLCAAAIAA